MSIRPLRPADLDDRATWLRFRQALFPECDDAMHAFEMDRHLTRGYVVFLAEIDNRAAGFIEVSERERVEHSTEDRVAYVEAWYVEPSHHGHGIGRALMQAAEKWTLARGLRELASDTDLSNAKGLTAHKALGFKETERIVTLLKRLR